MSAAFGVCTTGTNACRQVMNPSGTRSKPGAPATIPESVESTLDDILAEFAATEPWGQRRQQLLNKLVNQRRAILEPVVVDLILDDRFSFATVDAVL